MKAHEKEECCLHELQCGKCDYECQRENIIMEHMDTKHKVENINESDTEHGYMNKTKQ